MQGDQSDLNDCEWSALRPFLDLSPDTNDALATMRRLLRYSAGSIVVHHGETSDLVGLVLSVVLRMQ